MATQSQPTKPKSRNEGVKRSRMQWHTATFNRWISAVGYKEARGMAERYGVRDVFDSRVLEV